MPSSDTVCFAVADRAGGLKRAGEQYKPRALHTRTDFAMWAFFLTIGTMGEVHNGHFFSGDTSHMVYATLAEHVINTLPPLASTTTYPTVGCCCLLITVSKQSLIY